MGSLQETLGLGPVDSAAAELDEVLLRLCEASARDGRIAPGEVRAARERLTRIAEGHYLPDVAIAAALTEPEVPANPEPDDSHRVTTMVLDDCQAA